MGRLDGSGVSDFIKMVSKIFASKNPDKAIQDRTLIINEF